MSYRHRVEVRFRDCDPLGHVNHAVYFTYFEQARFAFWRELMGRRTYADPSFILAHAECDYRTAAVPEDVLEVRVSIAAVGRSSFTFEYEVFDVRAERLAATGKTVQVMYDYAAGKSIPIPDDVRTRLEGLKADMEV